MSRNTINMHIMQWLYKKVPLITLQGIIIYRCASLPLKVPPCQNQIAFSLKYTRSWANKLCNRTSQQAKASCNKYLSTHYKLCKTGIWRLLQFFFFFSFVFLPNRTPVKLQTSQHLYPYTAILLFITGQIPKHILFLFKWLFCTTT